MKVVINVCFGGFALSEKASNMFNELKGLGVEDEEYVDPEYGFVFEAERHDETLVKVVEELGEEANGDCSVLRVVELEENQYEIKDYDGNESIEQPTDTRSWITI